MGWIGFGLLMRQDGYGLHLGLVVVVVPEAFVVVVVVPDRPLLLPPLDPPPEDPPPCVDELALVVVVVFDDPLDPPPQATVPRPRTRQHVSADAIRTRRGCHVPIVPPFVFQSARRRGIVRTPAAVVQPPG